MHIKRLSLLFSALLMATTFLTAQNVHFTQYYMSPQTLNPAMTGNFNGTVRVGGIYREQWRSVIGKNRYTTPSVFVDAPILRGFRRKDWIAVGLMAFTDKAGESRLKHNAFKLAGAYHLALDKKGTTILTIGAHYGSETISIDPEGLRFADEIEDDMLVSPDRAGLPVVNNKDPKTSGNDVDAGILLTGKLNKKMGFNVGFSMFHLLKPDYGLLTSGGSNPNPNPNPNNSSVRRPIRSTLHGQFNIELTKQWSFDPNFLFQTTSGADEIILQGLMGYKLDPKQDQRVNFGLGYRFRDALAAIVGYQKGPLTVGLAYDINTSGLTTVSNNRGGWELAANYIFKIYKPAVVKPKIICPRY